MLLTLTTTYRPATDLGFLLHKHPDRVQAFEQSFGSAHVFYPEASDDRCTAALLLDVDPVRLARAHQRARGPESSLGRYVNDRPYAASSLFSVALADVFSTAMRGRCAARPQLAQIAMPLTVRLTAVPCRGGTHLAERLFTPLGWTVRAGKTLLDPALPGWGDSPYIDLTLSGTLRVADALNHVYVLLPVLDDAKHYWVTSDEVDKLLRAGEGWLAGHPERGLISRRYLAHRRRLWRGALVRLAEADDAEPEAFTAGDIEEEPEEYRASLADQRAGAVLAVLRAEGATSVLDIGCGSGRLLEQLLAEPRFTRVTGVDVSPHALELARRRLRADRLPEDQATRLELFQSSATYRDRRMRGYDTAVLMEVVEHLDPPRLPALERAVFGDARPGAIVVTTPNAEYNVRYEGVGPDRLRHRDHRFEWTRAQFAAWADGVAGRNGYRVRLLPVGPDDPGVGPSTQMGVFTR